MSATIQLCLIQLRNKDKRMEERSKKLLVLAGIGIFAWATILKKRNRSKTMRVKELYIYPIKSCKGIRVSSITFDNFGIENDRRWVLVDEKGNFIHQRVQPKLALVSTDIDKHYLRICAPRRRELLIPLNPRHLVKKVSIFIACKILLNV